MTFRLEFDTENAEFDDHIRIAMPHVLKNVAQVVALGGNRGNIRGFTGAHVGRWELDHPDDYDDWSPLDKREGTK
jgi:hypothetical protein